MMQTGSSADAYRDRGRLFVWATAVAFMVTVLVLGAIAFRPALSKADESAGLAILSSQIAGGIDIRAYVPVGLGEGLPDVRVGLPASVASAASLPTTEEVEGSAGWSPIGVGFAAGLAGALLTGAYLIGRSRSRSEVKALKAEMAQRAAAERERSRTEAFHRAHYNNTTDSIFVVKVEEDGRFTMADRNPAHVECFGTPGVEILGKELYEFMPADQAKWLTSFYEQCIETRGPIRYVVLFGLGHQPRHWETALSPIFDDTGRITHVIGAARDISDRIELEEKLHQSQKMEAMGQLTGGIAHDFNNLLTVVMGNLDLLKRAREAHRQRLTDNALQAVERARELTQKLLAFGRRQPLKPEPTDLKALIAGMDDMLMQSLRGDVRLEVDLPNDLWPVEVDQAQLQVALINLAANARDAMPRSGVLRIKAQNSFARGDEAIEGVALSVTDTGQGMPREVLDRAFDPFFTTKEASRGTGLGLAQVYGFANQSGGTAEIESEVGKGTTVTLYLPRCHLPVPVRTSVADEPAEWNRSLRILLVEDNVQVAEVAGSILTEQGHEVTTAHSADDALELLETGCHFNFVFSDLVMPGERDGLDLARLIRAWWPTLPVLLATGYSEAGGRATQEGFTLLAKPYRAATLVATIERLAAQSARGLAHSGAD